MFVETHDEGHGDGLVVLAADGELASGRRLKSELNIIFYNTLSFTGPNKFTKLLKPNNRALPNKIKIFVTLSTQL